MLTPRTIPVRLPDVCHVVIAGMPPGQNVAISRRGRLGVGVTGLDFRNEDSARRVVRAVNVCKRGLASGHGRDAVVERREPGDPAGFVLRTPYL